MKTTIVTKALVLLSIACFFSKQSQAVHINFPLSWTHTITNTNPNGCTSQSLSDCSSWSNNETFTIYCTNPGDADYTVTMSYKVFYSTSLNGSYSYIADVTHGSICPSSYQAMTAGYYYFDFFTLTITITSGSCSGFTNDYAINGKTGKVQVYFYPTSLATPIAPYLTLNGCTNVLNTNVVSGAQYYQWTQSSNFSTYHQTGTNNCSTCGVPPDETHTWYVRVDNPCSSPSGASHATLTTTCHQGCGCRLAGADGTTDDAVGISLKSNSVIEITLPESLLDQGLKIVGNDILGRIVFLKDLTATEEQFQISGIQNQLLLVRVMNATGDVLTTKKFMVNE